MLLGHAFRPKRITFPSHLQRFHPPPVLSLSSNAKVNPPSSPISLKLVTPDSKEPEIYRFGDASALNTFVKSYGGSLRGPLSNRYTVISARDYSSLTPDRVYEIVSPYFKAVDEQRHHNQNADKAFKSKARHALVKYLNEAGINYEEMEREIKCGKDAVAEWEGIFTIDGGVLFLECKNAITDVNITLSDLC